MSFKPITEIVDNKANFEQPDLNTIGWQIWLVSVIILILFNLRLFQLPIYEGYWTTLSIVTFLFAAAPPVLWIFKPTVWITKNFRARQQKSDIIEIALGWSIIICFAYATLVAQIVLAKHLLEPQTTFITHEYVVETYDACTRPDIDCLGFSIDDYQIVLNGNFKGIYHINKDTYDRINALPTTTHDKPQPLSITLKPDARVIFSIAEHKAQ